MTDVPYRADINNIPNKPTDLKSNLAPAQGLAPQVAPSTSTAQQPISVQSQPIESNVVPQVFPSQNMTTEQFAPTQSQVSAVGLGQLVTPTGEYAGFGRRFLATIIDGLVVGLLQFTILFITGFIFGLLNLTGLGILLGYILVIIAVLGYYVGLLVKKGATLGKMAMGIKVITVSGEPLTVGRVFLREIVGKFVSAFVLYFGFLSVLWDQKKQGWHDKIAGTVVVKA